MTCQRHLHIWAAVLARRESREAKSMREESGSEEDSDEPVEWEDDDEVSSEEDGSENEVRVSNAQRGRVRFHRASQSSTGLEVDDERSKSFMGEKGWARRAVVVRGVEPSGAADFEAVPGREEYDLGEDGSKAPLFRGLPTAWLPALLQAAFGTKAFFCTEDLTGLGLGCTPLNWSNRHQRTTVRS